MNKFPRTLLLTRFLALFLAVALGLPNPVFALRMTEISEQQRKTVQQQGGLEELENALLPSAGMEEKVSRRRFLTTTVGAALGAAAGAPWGSAFSGVIAERKYIKQSVRGKWELNPKLDPFDLTAVAGEVISYDSMYFNFDNIDPIMGEPIGEWARPSIRFATDVIRMQSGDLLGVEPAQNFIPYDLQRNPKVVERATKLGFLDPKIGFRMTLRTTANGQASFRLPIESLYNGKAVDTHEFDLVYLVFRALPDVAHRISNIQVQALTEEPIDRPDFGMGQLESRHAGWTEAGEMVMSLWPASKQGPFMTNDVQVRVVGNFFKQYGAVKALNVTITTPRSNELVTLDFSGWAGESGVYSGAKHTWQSYQRSKRWGAVFGSLLGMAAGGFAGWHLDRWLSRRGTENPTAGMEEIVVDKEGPPLKALWRAPDGRLYGKEPLMSRLVLLAEERMEIARLGQVAVGDDLRFDGKSGGIHAYRPLITVREYHQFGRDPDEKEGLLWIDADKLELKRNIPEIAPGASELDVGSVILPDGAIVALLDESVSRKQVVRYNAETWQPEVRGPYVVRSGRLRLNSQGTGLYAAEAETYQLLRLDPKSLEIVARVQNVSMMHGFVISPDGRDVVLLTDAGEIIRVDAWTLEVRARATLPPGKRPLYLQFSPDGKYLLLHGQSDLLRVDRDSLQVEATARFPSKALIYGISFYPSQDFGKPSAVPLLYVFTSSGLLRLDPAALIVEASASFVHAVGERGALLSNDGKDLWVIGDDRRVHLLDPMTLEVRAGNGPIVSSLQMMDPNGRKPYALGPGLYPIWMGRPDIYSRWIRLDARLSSGKDTAGPSTGPAAGLEEGNEVDFRAEVDVLREERNLLPVSGVVPQQEGVIAGPKGGLAYGLALSRFMFMLAFVVETPAQAEGLKALGVTPGMIFQVGKEYQGKRLESIQDAVDAAHGWFKEFWEVGAVEVGTPKEPVTGRMIQQILERYGIRLDEGSLALWGSFIDRANAVIDRWA